MNFKVGQKVICIAECRWYPVKDESKTCSGPRKDDILKIVSISVDNYLGFDTYADNSYEARHFRPLREQPPLEPPYRTVVIDPKVKQLTEEKIQLS